MRAGPLFLSMVLVAPGISAQTRPQARLNLSFTAGTVTVGAQLWSIEQPVVVQGTEDDSVPWYDTLGLARSIGSNNTFGFAMLYFPGSHVGFHAEVTYLGLRLQSSCDGVYYDPRDLERKNEALCTNVDATVQSLGAVGLQAGITLRAASRGAMSPYVRGGAGLVTYAPSTVVVEGATPRGIRRIINDETGQRVAATLHVGAGVTMPLGPGFHFRLEARDVVASHRRVDGPANGLAQAPTSARFYHHVSLTVGLDIVLEKKRGRRY